MSTFNTILVVPNSPEINTITAIQDAKLVTERDITTNAGDFTLRFYNLTTELKELNVGGNVFSVFDNIAQETSNTAWSNLATSFGFYPFKDFPTEVKLILPYMPSRQYTGFNLTALDPVDCKMDKLCHWVVDQYLSQKRLKAAKKETTVNTEKAKATNLEIHNFCFVRYDEFMLNNGPETISGQWRQITPGWVMLFNCDTSFFDTLLKATTANHKPYVVMRSTAKFPELVDAVELTPKTGIVYGMPYVHYMGVNIDKDTVMVYDDQLLTVFGVALGMHMAKEKSTMFNNPGNFRPAGFVPQPQFKPCGCPVNITCRCRVRPSPEPFYPAGSYIDRIRNIENSMHALHNELMHLKSELLNNSVNGQVFRRY